MLSFPIGANARQYRREAIPACVYVDLFRVETKCVRILTPTLRVWEMKKHCYFTKNGNARKIKFRTDMHDARMR